MKLFRCRQFFFLSVCLVFSVRVSGQKNDVIPEFGKITPAQYRIPAPGYDTGASAVIVADIGNTRFEGNKKGFFSIVFTRFTRVKILNKNGFHIADNQISLLDFGGGYLEKLTDLKAITYNLDNGIIHETPLDEKSVSDVELSKYRHELKFSIPGLKEGSIYDLTYTITSTIFSDPPTWGFQGSYPCLWSEYNVTIPSMFHYLTKIRGDNHFDIKTNGAIQERFGIQQVTATESPDVMMYAACKSFQNKWVKKNVPVLPRQSYISSPKNYESRIYFELQYFQQDERFEKDMKIKSWQQECHDLLNMKYFGFELNQVNNWMDEELGTVTRGSLSPEEESRRIFDLVRDQWVGKGNSDFYLNNQLKDVYKNRSGNTTELNLLLTAMLRHRNIDASPAILSTRENGVATLGVPLRYEYNYVICVANIMGKKILLDASKPFNSFGKLPGYCYNWYARLVDEDHPDSLILSPDSLREASLTNVFISNEENGKYSGTLQTLYGDDGSYNIREEVKMSSEKAYFKKIQDRYTDIQVSNFQIDSLKQSDFPVSLRYDLDFKDINKADVIYFNPVVAVDFKLDPLPAEERKFPVEMSYKTDDIYSLSMEIPKGFAVEELPKSARVNFNENQGMFEYLIQQNSENIQMRIHLKLDKATFRPDDYSSLRDFFAFVYKKENEQFVFKRIK